MCARSARARGQLGEQLRHARSAGTHPAREPFAHAHTRVPPAAILRVCSIAKQSVVSVSSAPSCGLCVLLMVGRPSAKVAQAVISQISAILDRVAKNPRNPNFNHYAFETLACLVQARARVHARQRTI